MRVFAVADNVPKGSHPLIEQGKLYRFREGDEPEYFTLLLDDEKTLSCSWKNSAYLKGRDWRRVAFI